MAEIHVQRLFNAILFKLYTGTVPKPMKTLKSLSFNFFFIYLF